MDRRNLRIKMEKLKKAWKNIWKEVGYTCLFTILLLVTFILFFGGGGFLIALFMGE